VNLSDNLRPADPADLDTLVDLMAEFYAESAAPFASEPAAWAFAAILADETLGRVWILELGGMAAGYAVLTFGFSMEYGGRDAFLDDLFVREPHRGCGLGRAAMEQVLDECARRGVRAVHLEVGRDNVPARELYRRFGFVDHDLQLMTFKLA
jgi:GNAT superfamily N-acetyltransferase